MLLLVLLTAVYFSSRKQRIFHGPRRGIYNLFRAPNIRVNIITVWRNNSRRGAGFAQHNTRFLVRNILRRKFLLRYVFVAVDLFLFFGVFFRRGQFFFFFPRAFVFFGGGF